MAATWTIPGCDILKFGQTPGNLSSERIASCCHCGKKEARRDRTEYPSCRRRELNRPLAGVLVEFSRVQYDEEILDPSSGQGGYQLVILPGHRRPESG